MFRFLQSDPSQISLDHLQKILKGNIINLTEKTLQNGGDDLISGLAGYLQMLMALARKLDGALGA